jgi:hypothetical protein
MKTDNEMIEALKKSKYPYEITLSVKAHLCQAPDISEGFMHFRFADTSADVKIDDKRIGEVSGCIGGGTEISISTETRSISYMIDAPTFWYALLDALGKWGFENKWKED